MLGFLLYSLYQTQPHTRYCDDSKKAVAALPQEEFAHYRPSTSFTGVCLAITMLQYYICVGIVLTVVLVLGLGLGFGIILYFVIGT